MYRDGESERKWERVEASSFSSLCQVHSIVDVGPLHWIQVVYTTNRNNTGNRVCLDPILDPVSDQHADRQMPPCRVTPYKYSAGGGGGGGEGEEWRRI